MQDQPLMTTIAPTRRHTVQPVRGERSRTVRAEELLACAAELHSQWNLGQPNDPAAEAALVQSCAMLGRVLRFPAYRDNAQLLCTRALQLRHLGRLDESGELLDRAVAADPAGGPQHLEHAHHLLMHGDYARGFAKYEHRLDKYAPGDRELPGVPRWDGRLLPGRTLMLNTVTDGYGDGIMCARFIGAARERAGRIVLSAYPALRRLLRGIPSVDHVAQPNDPPEDIAAQCALLSLPGALGTTLETIPPAPYLFPALPPLNRWRPVPFDGAQGRLAGLAGLKVGICWHGNPKLANDRFRSVALRHFAPLAAVPDVHLVSLQVGHGAEQLGGIGFRVLDSGPLFQTGDFLDTAVLIKQLDLVISVDTAVAHLAGALGVPVWLALPRTASWHWLIGRDDSPWYPTARLFRQTQRGDWDDVFRRMTLALRTR
jgi:hypothetical protein